MKLIKFNHTSAIYVPSTIRNKIASVEMQKSALDLAVNTMIDMFGGVTITKAQGGYKMADGEVVVENITVITSASDKLMTQKMYDLANEIGQMMDQESVAVVINGEMTLIEIEAVKMAA